MHRHAKHDSRLRDGRPATAPKVAVSLIVSLVLALAGGGAAQATWNTPERSVSASVNAGALSVTQSGFAALATTFSSAALTVTAPVAITNTGTVPAPFSLRFGAQAATALANAADVRVWAVSSAAGCTTSSVAAGPTGKTWVTVGAFTGTLAPATTAVYCVRSSVTQAQRFALVGATATATASVTATQGAWTSTVSATAAQTVANTLTPSVPTKTSETDSSITLAWNAPSDTAAVTGYQIYRDSALVATVPVGQRSYTDSGLDVLKYYSYTIRSAHAATPVDLSPATTAISHASGWVTTTSSYEIRNVGSLLCVTGEGAGNTAGSALVSSNCNRRGSQFWQLVVDGDYLKVTPTNTRTLFWDSPADHNSILRTTSNISAQKWEIVPVAPGSGTFYLRDRNNLCLDTTGPLTASNNTQLRVAACVGTASQMFTLRKVG